VRERERKIERRESYLDIELFNRRFLKEA